MEVSAKATVAITAIAVLKIIFESFIIQPFGKNIKNRQVLSNSNKLATISPCQARANRKSTLTVSGCLHHDIRQPENSLFFRSLGKFLFRNFSARYFFTHTISTMTMRTVNIFNGCFSCFRRNAHHFIKYSNRDNKKCSF